MQLLGSTERRIACLKIAAAMNKRMTKEDPIVSVDALIEYAHALSEFAYRGEGRPVSGEVQVTGDLEG